MLSEHDFQKKADLAFEDLKKRLLNLGDEHGFDVEGESGKLEVIFEEPELFPPVSNSAGPNPATPSSSRKPAKTFTP